MEQVKLRNGTSALKEDVEEIANYLKAFQNTQFVAFLEFVEKCRNPDHKMFGNTLKQCVETGLMDSRGSIDDSTRNITLAAVEGAGHNLKLVNPIATQEQNQPAHVARCSGP